MSNYFDNSFMQLALKEAEKAATCNEVPVGAILIDSHTNKIISQAHNLVITKKDPTAHAEMLAIINAAHSINNERLNNLDLYVTLEPCPMCAYAISLARIRRVYFGAYDAKGGGIENGPKIYNSSSCHYAPDVYGGIMENECSKTLIEFFKARR